MFVSNEIYRAIVTDQRAAIRKALAEGLDPDGCFSYSTLLTEAAFHGHLGIVRMLLVAGANPDRTGANGVSALYYAVQNKHVPVAMALIEGGATVDFCDDKNGCTPLYEAIRSYASLQSVELVRMLIEFGAELDRENAHGTPPRAWIVHDDDVELRALVDAIPIKTELAPVVPRPSPPHPQRRKLPADFPELYNALVPRSGPAATRIGELLRAIERLRNEALGNGNINWGPMFEAMVAYICLELADRGCDADLAELRSSTTRRLASEKMFDRLLDHIMAEWRQRGDTPR